MTARDPWFLMDGATALVDAEEARLGNSALWTPAASGVLTRSGVLPGPGTPLRVHQTVTASGSLLVEAGHAVIQGTTSSTQGTYTATLDAQLTVPYLASYPADAQPRKDLIVARINDKAYAGSTASFTIEVVKGTASGSPVDPATPASAIVLARVSLPASATTVADAVITDLRTFTVARGGVLPVLSSARPSTPFEGETIYETDTDALLTWDGSAWTVPGALSEASYTPTWTAAGGGAAVGNGSLTGTWSKDALGYIDFTITHTIGTTTNVGSGVYTYGLPATGAYTLWKPIGIASFTDNGSLAYTRTAVMNSSGTIGLTDSSGTRTSPTVPLSLTSTDVIQIVGRYKAA